MITPKQLTPQQLKNFWTKVSKNGPNGCWLWTGAGNRYGSVRIFGATYGAHQISFQIHRGSPPEGRAVLHKCDVPKCVNPDHLFSGTQRENVDDCVKKGRRAHGESSGTSKLTNDQVLSIRMQYAAGGISMRAIAIARGMGVRTVYNVISGKSWKHLPATFAREISKSVQITRVQAR